MHRGVRIRGQSFVQQSTGSLVVNPPGDDDCDNDENFACVNDDENDNDDEKEGDVKRLVYTTEQSQPETMSFKLDHDMMQNSDLFQCLQIYFDFL